MKITIDTKNPDVTDIVGPYSLDELIQYLSTRYPDFTWKRLESMGSIRLQMPPLPKPVDDNLPF